jgi:Ca-activated chloride channel family protein
VAEFGLLLRDSQFKGDATYAQVLQLAKEAKGQDEAGYRAEFIRLVETVELLK